MRVRGAGKVESCQFPSDFSDLDSGYFCDLENGRFFVGVSHSGGDPAKWRVRLQAPSIGFDVTQTFPGSESLLAFAVPGAFSSTQFSWTVEALDTCGVAQADTDAGPVTCE